MEWHPKCDVKINVAAIILKRSTSLSPVDKRSKHV
jgi:hypothetical protein